MSFDTNLPRQLAELRVKYTELRWKKADMFHSCGCEYCDYDGLKDDYTDDDVKKIDAEMKEFERTFHRVKQYAKLKDIDVSEEIICKYEKEYRDELRKSRWYDE